MRVSHIGVQRYNHNGDPMVYDDNLWASVSLENKYDKTPIEDLLNSMLADIDELKQSLEEANKNIKLLERQGH